MLLLFVIQIVLRSRISGRVPLRPCGAGSRDKLPGHGGTPECPPEPGSEYFPGKDRPHDPDSRGRLYRRTECPADLSGLRIFRCHDDSPMDDFSPDHIARVPASKVIVQFAAKYFQALLQGEGL